jgi:hypothetical protein
LQLGVRASSSSASHHRHDNGVGISVKHKFSGTVLAVQVVFDITRFTIFITGQAFVTFDITFVFGIFRVTEEFFFFALDRTDTAFSLFGISSSLDGSTFGVVDDQVIFEIRDHVRFIFTGSGFVIGFFTNDLSRFDTSFFVSDTFTVASVTHLNVRSQMEFNIDFSNELVVFRVHTTGFTFITRFILLDAAIPFHTTTAGVTIGMFSFDPVSNVARLVSETEFVLGRSITENGAIATLAFIDRTTFVVRMSTNGNSVKTALRVTFFGSNVDVAFLTFTVAVIRFAFVMFTAFTSRTQDFVLQASRSSQTRLRIILDSEVLDFSIINTFVDSTRVGSFPNRVPRFSFTVPFTVTTVDNAFISGTETVFENGGAIFIHDLFNVDAASFIGQFNVFASGLFRTASNIGSTDLILTTEGTLYRRTSRNNSLSVADGTITQGIKVSTHVSRQFRINTDISHAILSPAAIFQNNTTIGLTFRTSHLFSLVFVVRALFGQIRADSRFSVRSTFTNEASIGQFNIFRVRLSPRTIFDGLDNTIVISTMLTSNFSTFSLPARTSTEITNALTEVTFTVSLVFPGILRFSQVVVMI